MSRTQESTKMAAKVPHAAEARIVELSLQNPDFGPRRLLPLLKKEQITVSASAVYNILKRNGLNTRAKRLVKLEKPHATETLLPQEADLPVTPEEIAPAVGAAVIFAAPSGVSPSPGIPVRASARRPLLLTLFNFILLALLVLLGIYTVQHVGSGGLAPAAQAAIEPVPASADTQPQAAARPLSDYRVIWQRDLFKTTGEKFTAPKKEIWLDKIDLATEDIGLKLVGTVVADDPAISIAVIDNRSTRQQEAYREGDRTGEIRIKKILRTKVIITTEEGDRLLMVDIGGASKSSNPAITYAQRTSASQVYPQQAAGRRLPGRSISLARKKVRASLANIDELEQQLNIAPYMKDDQPAGFTISSIPPQSILRKMDLKNGVAIMEVNGEAITGPDQAAEFFQTLAEGGKMTIKVRKGRGVRRRTRYIHLNIE